MSARTLTSSPSTVTVRPDLVFPEWFEAKRLTIGEYPELEFSVRAEWDASRLAYNLVELRIERQDGIKSEDLRELSRNEILSAARPLWMEVVSANGEHTQHTWSRELISQVQKARPTDETLRWISRHYAEARAYGTPPNKAVMRTFGLSQTTATRWIAEARRRGLLD